MGRPKDFDPEHVVATAMDAFWSKGYAATSPADLAEAAGIGKGSLYNTFGSKRELFGQALDLYGRMGSEVTEEFLSEPGTAKERINAYLRFLVDMDLSGPARRGCLAANTVMELGGRDAQATQTVHQITTQNIELLTNRIRQGQRDGDVPSDVNAVSHAHFLMNTIVGLRVMAKTFDGPDLYRIIDTALIGL